MNICFNLGFSDEDNKVFARVLKGKNDNNDYHTASSVKDLLDMVTGQKKEFGRIFFSDAMLINPQEDLTVLKRYFSQKSPVTEIIYVTKDSVRTKHCEKLFKSIMRGGNYIVIANGESSALDSLFLEDLVCADIRTLKEKYMPEEDRQATGYAPAAKVEDEPIDEDLFESDEGTDDDFDMGSLKNYRYGDELEQEDEKEEEAPMPPVYSRDTGYGEEEDTDFSKIVCDIPRKKYLIFIGDETTEINKLATQIADNLGASYEKKTLLVDLDSKHNYLLGDFETNSFYEQDCNYGIKNQKPYVENEYIELLSNGYGTTIDASELNMLYEMGAYDPYDYVIFCCPIDGLSILNAKLVSRSEIRIIVRSSYQNMLYALQCASDRDNVTGQMEDLLYENSKVYLIHPYNFYDNEDLQAFFEEDREKISSNVVCTRYNWVLGDNIEIVIADS